jgi:Xaa-Pro aminopeptidase
MFRRHREALLAALEREDAAGIFFAGSPKIRNHDSEYRFRPDSDFYWLTGFGEPEAALVLLPRGAPGRPQLRSVAFVRPRSREDELWSGRRLGVEDAPARLGVDQAFEVADLLPRLGELLKGYARACYRTGLDEGRDRAILQLAAKLRAQAKLGVMAPERWLEPAAVLHDLRLVKDADELALMRRAAEVSAAAHALAFEAVRPGVHEREIEALVEGTFRRLGADAPAYASIVAGGANACVLHYVESASVLEDGALVLIDAGAEWSGYASDVTRTFPIGGRFSPEQRALYELVLAAQAAALAEVGPGRRFHAAHEAAVKVLAGGLVELGLLAGTPEAAIAEETYKRFFMHRTGHWLGLDVHDCGAYFVDGRSRVLAPGMVVTVEPGLYVAPDDGSVEARWRGIGIRIEDDVLVTESGREVLTAAIEKRTSALERGRELSAARRG